MPVMKPSATSERTQWMPRLAILLIWTSTADLQCGYGHSADTANLLKTLDTAKSLF
jgi:hypothetical protein